MLICILLSCESVLDLTPENSLTYTNAFKNEQNIDATTTSMHFLLNIYIAKENPFISVGAIMDENANSSVISLREWDPQAVKKTWLRSWKNIYDIIYEGNLLIDNIHRAEDLKEDRRDFHLGQAYFAKGIAYFELARRFGDCIITKDSKTIEPYPISSALEVMSTAIESAKKAYDMLPVYSELKDIDGSIITNRQYASKSTAAALLSQIYAWRGSMIDLYNYQGNSKEDYELCVKYASEIIDQKLGSYALVDTHENLCELMSNPSLENPEVIFNIPFDKLRSEYSMTPCPGANYISWPVNETVTLGELTVDTDTRLHKSTVDKLYSDPNDKRRKAFFYKLDEDHSVDGKSYAIMYKWRKALYATAPWNPSGKSLRSLDADYNYWRLTGLYLLRAECYAKLSNKAAAIEDLNVIRRRAGIKEYPAAGESDLKYAIFHEREREFIGEGHRYYDIIRNNYVKQELQGHFKELTTQDIKDGALYLPVPESAFETKEGIPINDLVRQNRYWSKYI